MISKEELRDLLNDSQTYDFGVEFHYIPISVIESAENMYDLYYSGPRKIRFSKGYVQIKLLEELDASKIDSYVDEIYELLKDDVRNEIQQAFKNLELCAEDIKYFDRKENKEIFKQFQDEVRANAGVL